MGTRPEIVKMSPVIHECDRRGISYYLLHTGQHYSDNMSDSFFHDLAIGEPDENLNIGSGSHAEQTAKALVGIEKSLLKQTPDVVLALGDTNAVLSTALAAVKLQIPVAHIEAGLRSYDYRMPEEHNRRLTDHISDYLFAPTEESKRNLQDENVRGEILVTGNTVIDALENRLPAALERDPPVTGFDVKDYVLLTMHRAENVDNKSILTGLVQGLLSLGKKLLFPAHPRTVARLKEFGLMRLIEDSGLLRIIDPVGYLDFLRLMHDSEYVITDSGGIQEEVTSPSLNKRVYVIRSSTERPEAVKSGHSLVVGVDPSVFPKLITEAMPDNDRKRTSPYGDGKASGRIIDFLMKKHV